MSDFMITEQEQAALEMTGYQHAKEQAAKKKKLQSKSDPGRWLIVVFVLWQFEMTAMVSFRSWQLVQDEMFSTFDQSVASPSRVSRWVVR